ncbi:MAG TPA: DHA2 family efflux MFS transporter permease subunit, partial [Microthrixaceae bacterium]|nr:DHA2 family efflux MFS transporter permease subunit [Microthrixaceae bacterium]
EFGLDHGIDPEVFAKRWWTLGVLCLSLLIIMIGNTSLNVAIPILSEKLHSTNSQLQWMVDAYSLVFAGLLFTAGNFGDRYGRKGILQAGLVLFGLSTAYAGFFADSSATLIGARLVMGAGAAMVMPATLSIITNIFPTHERAKAVALWAGISGAGSALGPLLTGFVLEHADWNAVFLVNIPFIVLALILGVSLVPRSKGESGTPLDIPGAILSGVGLSVFIYALIEAPTHGWLSPTTIGIASVGLFTIAAFVFHELRTEFPMLDVRLFRIRSFGASSLILTMVFFALMGTFFSLTQLLQLAWGYSALEAAIRLLPISAAMMIAAPQSANMAERFGKSRVVGFGMGLVAVGIFMISRVGVHPGYPLLVSGASIMAFGMGLAMSPTTDLLMSSVPRKNAGMGSAMNDTTRELGGSLGVAIFGSLLASKYVSGLSDLLPSLPAEAREFVGGSLGGAMSVASKDPVHGKAILETATQAWVDGLRLSLLIASVIVACAGVLAWRLLPNQAADVEALEHAHAAEKNEVQGLGDPSLA